MVNDIEIELIKKDIKKLHLSVHPPDGRVRISAPKKMDDEAIRLFVISKLSWIKKQRSKFKLTGDKFSLRLPFLFFKL
ncbi:MAG TPA: M48 family metallopeptidase [Clostridiaceae bacterium]|nr:M48 family metallopeptidase [Clostridiaceae bacterium]